MFKTRSEEKELMDDLSSSGNTMDQTLGELHLVNKWLGGYSVLLNGLSSIVVNNKLPAGRSLRIADIGCGGSEGLEAVYQWAIRNDIPVQLTGFDANPYIVELVSQKVEHLPDVSVKCLDVFSDDFQEQEFDIGICSLFCHHFTDMQLRLLFNRLYKQATMAVLINDLHRHPFAYYSIRAITWILSRSPMVKYDAPLSVLKAFKRDELEKVLIDSGIKRFDIRWMWAFRYQVLMWR